MGGWVKCPIGNKKIGKHIYIQYFITFLGEHSNVNNVINALLCLCYCVYVQVFEIFRTEGCVGGVYHIQTFFGYLYKFVLYLQGP